MNDRRNLLRFAWLSIGTAVCTIVLKFGAYWLTGSVGLLSDGLESGVNLLTAVIALICLHIAAQPPDAEHAYGHTKVEYFAGGLEGIFIFIAGGLIGYTAVLRLIDPQPLEQIGLGVVISVVASLLNLGTAVILQRIGKKHNSLTLIAESKHLMTDVWTSAGVIVGVILVGLTGWLRLDAFVALLVAGNILFTGYHLLKAAVSGLMDSALPDEEQEQIKTILERYHDQGVAYHAVRTRQSGAQRFLSFHMQMPGAWSVQQGHTLAEEIEADIIRELAPISVFIHLEPLEDPASWQDIPLNRSVLAK